MGVLPIVWTVITAPIAIISALSDLLNIDGLLLAPVATYRAAAVDTASALGLSLPVACWVIDVVMLALAAGVLAWLFFTRLFLESRSQWRAAREGRAIAVNPQARRRTGRHCAIQHPDVQGQRAPQASHRVRDRCRDRRRQLRGSLVCKILNLTRTKSQHRTYTEHAIWG
ncbi:hypothetical protein [Brevundimonas subvibrioides]|uniref:hypothetical protein n=1 Tax=Brevundimonas subvibrioides TaxID=74313 RepID=UPI0022B5E0E4|nr:hypothetical protein [Brevundimonas subvibrioides]